MTEGLRGNAFIVTTVDLATGGAVRWVTPLLLAPFLIQFVDLGFAVDSGPAIFDVGCAAEPRFRASYAVSPHKAKFRFRDAHCGDRRPALGRQETLSIDRRMSAS